MRPLRRPTYRATRDFANQIKNGNRVNVPISDTTANYEKGGEMTNQDVDTSEKSSYELARNSLILFFGGYCSFCEIPIEANLAIEHMLPKSKYPHLQSQWANLLLSCPNCNSTKGNRELCDVPGRESTVKAKDVSYFPTMKVSFTLKDDSPFTYTRASATADVVVTGNDVLARDLIKLCGLNANSDPNNYKVSDRRKFFRNNAWNLADAAITRLLNFYKLTKDPVVRDIMHRQILATAVHTGFWSVWVTCFWNKLKNMNNNSLLLNYYDLNNSMMDVYKDGNDYLEYKESKHQQLIQKLFCDGFPNLSLYFPGTNPAFLGEALI